MRRTGLGYALILGLSLAARAETLDLGGLALSVAPPWQRAAAEEEARAGGILLRRDDLVLLIPAHRPRLRTDEGRFFQQLETLWRARYGEQLALDWLTAAGLRWRVARRPSLDHADAVVFHVVGVAAGQALHLVVHAPAHVTALPPAVHALLAGLAAPGSPPAGRWTLVERIHGLPADNALDALLAAERARLPGEGGVTGVRLQLQEDGLVTALQGYVAQRAGRAQRRQPVEWEWHLRWRPPAATLPASGRLTLQPTQLPAQVRLEVALRTWCGSEAAVRAWAGQLRQGSASEGLPAAACETAAAHTTLLRVGASPPAADLLLPPAASADPAVPVWLLLSVRPVLDGEGPGAALLPALAVHYLYRFEPQGNAE
ncbi:MAG: hypothetical protein RMK60_05975 [Burkholderiales bacterium]|nr:hypothetical protein [Burkholderiales bacterium]